MARIETVLLSRPAVRRVLPQRGFGGTGSLRGVAGSFGAEWLDIAQSKWETQQTLEDGRDVVLRAPQSGPWVVLFANGGEARVLQR
jgi:hypothetical protein